MALEDTLWINYGESRTARVADLRTIIPRHIQRAVGPFTVYAVPHPITAQRHPLQPLVLATMRGRSAAIPAHPYLQGGHIPRHHTQGPTHLPPARGGLPPRHTATPR